MRWLVAVGTLLLAAFPVTGSLVEDTVPVTYQHDGGVEGDAPGDCLQAQPERGVTLDANASSGMLVEYDDESDVYAFELTEENVGTRVSLSILAGITVDRYDIAFDVFAPGCEMSVFDYDSAYYDRPPEDPYQPPAGMGTHEATLTGHTCDPGQWKFIANQMHGLPAPVDIYVQWTNGEYEYVAVDKSTPATIAMYRTSSHLDVQVERAVIVLPPTWHGSFHLASGPCNVPVGTPPEPPENTTRYGEFTVQEAGTHVVHVFIAQGTVDKTLGTVEGLLADPSLSVPVNCHADLCSAALGFVDYDVGSKSTA